MQDTFSNTVDAARALAEYEPLLGEDVGNYFPGMRDDDQPLVPYVSSLTPGIVRKACDRCGTRVPHVGVEIALHFDAIVGVPCAAGTVRFG